MKPSKQALKAADMIMKKYGTYLTSGRFGNQDEDCCRAALAEIISRHCDREPEYLSEAFNSGDGTYRP